MTDLDITRLCAEAMGWQRVRISALAVPGIHVDPPFIVGSLTGTSIDELYDPLHDDAQCMALIKRLDVALYRVGPYDWQASIWSRERTQLVWSTENVPDLNRVVCECVAKMQQAKIKEVQP